MEFGSLHYKCSLTSITPKDTAWHTRESRNEKDMENRIWHQTYLPKFFVDFLIFQLLPNIIPLVILPMILQFCLSNFLRLLVISQIQPNS